jgi:hypothetical protein
LVLPGRILFPPEDRPRFQTPTTIGSKPLQNEHTLTDFLPTLKVKKISLLKL